VCVEGLSSDKRSLGYTVALGTEDVAHHVDEIRLRIIDKIDRHLLKSIIGYNLN
jgi:hypothetical protein